MQTWDQLSENEKIVQVAVCIMIGLINTMARKTSKDV